MSDSELLMLKKNFSACSERLGSLIFSMEKMAYLFPLSLDRLGDITEEQKESIDAYIFRYTQCVSMMQDHIFKGIAIAEQEDLSDKSNRDKSLLMEKLGAIESADSFGSATVLRNKFAHVYPEESKEQLEKLNLLPVKSEFVVDAFNHLVFYAVKKGLIEEDIFSRLLYK